MSTRSGKRIHASADSPPMDTEIILQSERKRGSKKQKENMEVCVKQKQNYVSYPADENTPSFSNDSAETQEKARKTRKTRRNTLKEHNIDVPVFNNLDSNYGDESVRKTRRGKKLVEDSNNACDVETVQNNLKPEPNANNKTRSKKKKSHKKGSVKTAAMQDITKQAAKKKDIKTRNRSNYTMMNAQEGKQLDTAIGDTSVDSFHSAAGSPVNTKVVKNGDQTEIAISYVEHELKNNMSTPINKSGDALALSESPLDVTVKKRKSSIKNSTFDKIEIKDIGSVRLSYTINKSPHVMTVSNTAVMLSTKKKRKSGITNSIFDSIDTNNPNEDNLNKTFDKTVDAFDTKIDVLLETNRRSSNRNSVMDNIEINNQDINKLNTTFDKVGATLSALNTTVNASTRKRKKSIVKNSTSKKNALQKTIAADDDKFNLTNDHIIAVSPVDNNTIDNSDVSLKLAAVQDTEHLNIPSDNIVNSSLQKLSNRKRKSTARKYSINDVQKCVEEYDIKDTKDMFHKTCADPQTTSFIHESLESKIPSEKKQIQNDCVFPTLNYNKNVELNTTYDTEKKLDVSVDLKKSSLISSDATINVTFNRSEENSYISITTDESKTDNILNHTPVLIDSSINESLKFEDKTPKKSEIPVTPLKREGTFTKEVSDFVTSPIFKATAEKTPTRRKSSPGSTPYPHSKSSQKENTKLNVTRSIEKSLRRSSLVEMAPRQTRVMFCSPVNNTAVVAQIKGRVIKSNLKGSNKSFLLEDSVPPTAYSGRRKRSLTLGAVDAVGEAETRAKRKRLGDELQQSVDRLSRPRTVSAAAKFPDPGTPSKKSVTPSKAKPESKVPRTKLPNFAVLHQKQFAKMESLDECQERRAKRARQLLTPTGSVALLERISPKGTPPKSAPPAKEPATKLLTPFKPNLPTLESLNPGYTRFGFKLNVDVNPFTVTRPTEAGRRDRAGESVRQPTRSALPSLAGAATGGRRDAAKRAVMREKSCAGRDLKRNESRTIIKGVRTNRRFELQMKLRNVNA